MNSGLQRGLFIQEAFDLLSNTVILAAFYGVAFVLYCLCASLLYLQQQDPNNRRQARFTLGYISLVFFCITAFLILSSRMAQLAYINHADFPGGPQEYEQSYNPTTNSYETATALFDLIVEALTMSIQIWRLWLIWSGTQYAVAVSVLPVLLLLCYIGLKTLDSIVAGLVPLDQLGISDNIWNKMSTATYAILSSLTILVTALVIVRLALVRRRHVRIMGTLDISIPYTSIIAMLIESYALESAWSIAAAISDGLDGPSYFLFINNDSTVKVLTYFLVVYRVASGRGWTRDTERKITSLQWNRETQITTDETSRFCAQGPVATMFSIGSFGSNTNV